MTQMQSGKAFEYSILIEFKEKLDKVTNVHVVPNKSLSIAKQCFDFFSKEEQGRYLLTSSFAVNFLMDIEPKLGNDFGADDILQLEIVTDRQGQSGDVRDIIVIRSLQKWEIGISAKNNHKAVKHSRLSNSIDFGQKWLGIGCSNEYFNEIRPIFRRLEKMKLANDAIKVWKMLPNKEDEIYMPVLNAFRKELHRIYKIAPKESASRLVEYLVGAKDFYKVIKGNNQVEIQAYNLHGSLNLPFQDIQPKLITPRISLPDKILDISLKRNSKNTLMIKFNNDWKLSFRIHNASTRIEPSLKFDINLLEAPSSLFTNTLSISY